MQTNLIQKALRVSEHKIDNWKSWRLPMNSSRTEPNLTQHETSPLIPITFFLWVSVPLTSHWYCAGWPGRQGSHPCCSLPGAGWWGCGAPQQEGWSGGAQSPRESPSSGNQSGLAPTATGEKTTTLVQLIDDTVYYTEMRLGAKRKLNNMDYY